MSLKRTIPITTVTGFGVSAVFVLTILNILIKNMPLGIDRAGNELLNLNSSDGVANAVTTVVVYFRGFDTLGEIAVLFIASLGIGLILKSSNREDTPREDSNFMLKIGARLLSPIILIFGLYIMIYGHLSVGGGFQGGVIIASGILLLLISSNQFQISHKVVEIFETLAGVSYVLIGLVGLLVMDSFLGNFLPHNISQMGLLISGGIIPIIYIFVGIKVGSEMSVIVDNMLKREL
jgi:multicomponent Na+:H+ antiporter subunit B